MRHSDIMFNASFCHERRSNGREEVTKLRDKVINDKVPQCAKKKGVSSEQIKNALCGEYSWVCPDEATKVKSQDNGVQVSAHQGDTSPQKMLTI